MVLDKKQLHSKSCLVVNVAMFPAPFDQLYQGEMPRKNPED